MKRIALTLSIAAALIALARAPAGAQSLELQTRLENAKRIECSFSALATGAWDGTTPEISASEADLEVAFEDINVDEGTAEADSDFGKSFIVVRYSEGYLHLLQMSNAGPLRVTTVLAQETSNGRLKAIQTRHEYTPIVLPGFTSRPEMYIGDCKVDD
jgi:hypothetical protein